jgi:hypothetical protein
MKKKRWILTFIFLVNVAMGYSQPVFKAVSGEASFFSEAPLENIEAHSKGVNSFLNTSTQEVAFIISIRGFRFAKSLMQEHFNEKYMESDKYPNATFKGKINGDVDLTKDGTYPVTSTGKLSIHGVEKEVTHSGTLVVSKKEITLTSEFNCAVKDYNISIPKLLFQNIADTVLVKINVTYTPYQK